MENVAPPLDVCGSVRMRLEAGDSLMSIMHGLLQEKSCPMRQDLLELQICHEKKQRLIISRKMSHERRALLELLYLGLCGTPIRQPLIALEAEMLEANQREIEQFVAVLPVKLLLPTIFLIFPALLIILIGPVMNQILEGLL